MNTTTLASTPRPSPAQVARLVLGLFKLRIGVLIMVTALVGLAVTPGVSPSLVQVAVLALAVLLGYLAELTGSIVLAALADLAAVANAWLQAPLIASYLSFAYLFFLQQRQPERAVLAQ